MFATFDWHSAGNSDYLLGIMSKITSTTELNPSEDLLLKTKGPYATILAGPTWQFQNRTGKVAPEHRRFLRYPTMELKETMQLLESSIGYAAKNLD